MEKKLYWELTNNADMCVTVQDLETVKQIIEVNQKDTKLDDDEELFYTITPVYLTDMEWVNLGESESY